MVDCGGVVCLGGLFAGLGGFGWFGLFCFGGAAGWFSWWVVVPGLSAD